MSRAFWKGTLSFGLVEIPVALHSAVARAEEIQFTMLDKEDWSPIRYERVSSATGRKVPWEDVVKGYEHEKGEYVVLTEDEIRGAAPEGTHAIEIVDFVDAAAIDPAFYEAPYYLEPTSKKSKSYALLRETLRRSGRVGIARIVLRTRQRIAAVGVRGPAIALVMLRYAYELKDPSEVEVPTGSAKDLGITEKELALAQHLVDDMATEWKPDAYEDEYRDVVLALVERKVREGKTKEVLEMPKRRPEKKGDVLDLMPLLERSLARGGKAAAAERSRSAPKTAARRRKKRAS